MAFREQLKSKISYKGYLLKEIASQAGISKRTLDSYVDSRAAMPPADIAVKLAKALDVTVEYLVTGESPTAEKNNTNYKRYKYLLSELDKLTADEYEKTEPFLLSTIKTQLDQRVRKTSKTG